MQQNEFSSRKFLEIKKKKVSKPCFDSEDHSESYGNTSTTRMHELSRNEQIFLH